MKQLYAQKRKLSGSFFKSRLYDEAIKQALVQTGVPDNEIEEKLYLLKILTFFNNGLEIDKHNPPLPYFEELFNDKNVQRYLQMNEFEGTIYFNKEQFGKLLFWLFINRTIRIIEENQEKITAVKINSTYREMNKYLKLAEKCGYKGEVFLEELEEN
ncbi:MAG: hypothetical protein P8X42_08210 [Calditrichaceae bacterium]